MPNDGSIYRNQRLPSWIMTAKTQSRKAVARSRELLKEPLPDTFLGRQHSDPNAGDVYRIYTCKRCGHVGWCK